MQGFFSGQHPIRLFQVRQQATRENGRRENGTFRDVHLCARCFHHNNPDAIPEVAPVNSERLGKRFSTQREREAAWRRHFFGRRMPKERTLIPRHLAVSRVFSSQSIAKKRFAARSESAKWVFDFWRTRSGCWPRLTLRAGVPLGPGVSLCLREKNRRNLLLHQDFRRGNFFSLEIAVRRIAVSFFVQTFYDYHERTPIAAGNAGRYASWSKKHSCGGASAGSFGIGAGRP